MPKSYASTRIYMENILPMLFVRYLKEMKFHLNLMVVRGIPRIIFESLYRAVTSKLSRRFSRRCEKSSSGPRDPALNDNAHRRLIPYRRLLPQFE